MANTASRIYPSGLLSVNGNLDEVTISTNANNIADSRNLLWHSQDFSVLNQWNVSGGSIQPIANMSLAPDGSRTASLWSATGLYPNLTKHYGFFVNPGEVYTYSIYVKYYNQATVTLVNEEGWSSYYAIFNIQTGVISGLGVSPASITPVGNGWYRISITYVVPPKNPNILQVWGNETIVRLHPQVRIGNYDGTNYSGSKVYIWGAQLEKGSVATAYMPTYELRNRAYYSQDLEKTVGYSLDNCSVIKNSMYAPDGTLTADTLVSTITGGSNTCWANQAVYNLPNNTDLTYSVYVKQGTSPTTLIDFYVNSPYAEIRGTITWGTTPTFVTSVNGGVVVASAFTSAGGGWYRASLTLNTLGTTNGAISSRVYVRGQGTDNVTGEYVYVWGWQVELGRGATTYSPSTFNCMKVYPLNKKLNTNLLTYSQDFSDASWTKTLLTLGTNTTVLAPDGLTYAPKLVTSSDATAQFHYLDKTYSVTSGVTYTVSVFVKADVFTRVALYQNSGTSGVMYNLSTAGVMQLDSGVTSTITPCDNGWYRITNTYTYASSGTVGVRVYLVDTAGTSFIGNGTSSIYVWGMQFEYGSSARPYERNLGTISTILPVKLPSKKEDTIGDVYVLDSFDEVTYNPSSNVAANIFNYSEDINQWILNNAIRTSNVTVAPDGKLTADLMVENTVLTEHGFAFADYYDNAMMNKTFTLSVFVKPFGRSVITLSMSNYTNADARANFNVSTGVILSYSNSEVDFTNVSGTITNVGNGWYRCSLTATKLAYSNHLVPNVMINNGSTTYYTGDGVSGLYIWGAQFENSSTMSEYVPKSAGSIVKRFSNRITANGSNYVTANYDEVNKPHVVQNLLLYLDPSISPVSANTFYDTVDPTRAFVITNPELCDVSNTSMIKWNRSVIPKIGSGAKWTSSGALAVSNFLYNNHTWEIWFRINDHNPINVYNTSEITEGAGVLSVYSGYHGGFMHTTTGVIYEIWDGISTARDPVTFTLGPHYQQGQWYQFVVTRSGNTFAGYINGVTSGTVNNSFTYSNVGLGTGNDLYIGKSQNLSPGQGGYVYYTKGDFGGMRMYNRALSPAEVLQNFNANRSKFGI